MFKFKNSRKSNNGTDVSSGQIPEILYRIPEFEQESGVSIQLLDKDFSLTVAPVSTLTHMYMLTHFLVHVLCLYGIFSNKFL